ncbi:MAG: 50S ribosomal protein L6 [Candidatus Gastranaerophilales bacterium]|nr:50S ribosomal protein L6 [Candidatus Gastranaerophilales bacterium]
MSRIGKKPVEIPSGVEVTISGNVITAKGPLGQECVEVRPEITIEKQDNILVISRKDDSREARSFHGLYRTLINNLVVGVKDGFVKNLEINGVGYRVAKAGKDLDFQLGCSHPVKVLAPEGVEFIVEGTNKITVKGRNKQVVGDVAAEIRSKRPSEVYKGKGIKYAGEHIRRKAGKTGKK